METEVPVPLRALENQIFAAFSSKDGAKISATLGDDTDAARRTFSSSGSVSLNSINYRQLCNSGPRALNRFAGQDLFAEQGSCDCSTDSDWCPTSGYCNATGCNRLRAVVERFGPIRVMEHHANELYFTKSMDQVSFGDT